jgi:hypothetical protein
MRLLDYRDLREKGIKYSRAQLWRLRLRDPAASGHLVQILQRHTGKPEMQ